MGELVDGGCGLVLTMALAGQVRESGVVDGALLGC